MAGPAEKTRRPRSDVRAGVASLASHTAGERRLTLAVAGPMGTTRGLGETLGVPPCILAVPERPRHWNLHRRLARYSAVGSGVWTGLCPNVSARLPSPQRIRCPAETAPVAPGGTQSPRMVTVVNFLRLDRQTRSRERVCPPRDRMFVQCEGGPCPSRLEPLPSSARNRGTGRRVRPDRPGRTAGMALSLRTQFLVTDLL